MAPGSGHAAVGSRRPAPGNPGTIDLDHSIDPLDEELDGDEVWDDEATGDDFGEVAGPLPRAVAWLRDPAPDLVQPAPRWRIWAAFVLSAAGVGVSTYLTLAHYTSAVSLACNPNSIVNCEAVTTSPQSEVFGVLPVAVLGLAFYLVMLGINLPPLWRVRDRRVHVARLAMAVAGMGMVLYLIFAELLQIGFICLWCTSVHVITFLLFVLVLSTVPAMVGWTGWATQEEDDADFGDGPDVGDDADFGDGPDVGDDADVGDGPDFGDGAAFRTEAADETGEIVDGGEAEDR